MLAQPTGPAITYEAYLALGQGVAIARGCANALKLNTVLILLPVCRNLLTFLRGTRFVNKVLPLDQNLFFHKCIGAVIVVLAVAHACAHYTNYNKLSVAGPHGVPLGPPLTSFGPRGLIPEPQWYLAYFQLTGLTGHLAFFFLFALASSAMEAVRRQGFEVFWYTHQIAALGFYGSLLAHGWGQLLEPAIFWAWFIGPATLYLIERIIRIARGSLRTKLVVAVQHPANVMEIRLQRADGKPFRYKSGQYCFIRCDQVSLTEWHPFTITSAPNANDYLSFHIKDSGDWTHKLHALLNASGDVGNVDVAKKIGFHVDGGLGAASEEIFAYENAIMVGAGVGVTPFVSVLRNIHATITNEDQGGFHFDSDGHASPLLGKKIRHVHFYWVTRDLESWEWVSEILADLEHHALGKYLQIDIFLTGKNLKMQDEMESGVLSRHSSSGRRRIHFCRPDWAEIFLQKAQALRGQETGVFFCGPKSIATALKKECRLHTDKTSKTCKTIFHFRKEYF